jgi:malate dehydrogenase
MKISIIGAGNVGSTLAERVLANNLADVALVDIAGDLARAKALDIKDATPLLGYKKHIEGTGDYKEVAGSGIIVITAGFPRKPGMSRNDLIEKNGAIIKSVLKNIKAYSEGAIFIVVTNPLDIMTYLAYKEAGCGRGRILGMAGNLDGARFKVLLSEKLNVPAEKIETFVVGSHGDTMVPLVSKTLVEERPLKDVLKPEEIKALLEKTKKRGGEIVRLLKSGSAYFSPSAAVLEILKAIINDEKKVMTCSCVLEGEYGIKGCAIGVPARIGKNGTEVLEWKLPEDERAALKKSASHTGEKHAGSK